MNVTCLDCRTVYRVDPRKIPERGIRARCARCPSEILIVADATHGQRGEPVHAGDGDSYGTVESTRQVGAEGGMVEVGADLPASDRGWDEAEWRRESEVGNETDEDDVLRLVDSGADESGRYDREHVDSVPANVDQDDGFRGSEADDDLSEHVAPVAGLQTDPLGDEPDEVHADSRESWSVEDREQGEPASAAGASSGLGTDESTLDDPEVSSHAATDSWESEGGLAESAAHDADREAEGSPDQTDEDRIEIVGSEYGLGDSPASQVADEYSSDAETGVAPREYPEDVADDVVTDAEATSAVEEEVEEVAVPDLREPAVPVEVHRAQEAESLAGFSESSRPSYAEPELPPAPFGSSDPHVRAKRLARALVSDIVVYHPDRRDRSLREGTLRQEFREEIRKSWDEYVGHVGEQIARDTSYFRDALNELLAGGDQLF